MTINISERTGGMKAQPVSFDGCVGIFHPALGDTQKNTAVLFVSPWGMEELCSRKFQRVIAERLGAVGIASLRFDYHGAGDALDPQDVGKDADWSANARSALNCLREISGVSSVVIVAQGLGCLIAMQAFADETSVSGMALLAPVVSGRAYLRETAMWSSMIDDGLGLRPEQRLATPGSIASMEMPAVVAERIKKTNLSSPTVVPAGRLLVLTRPGRVTDADFARHLQTLAGDVQEDEFTGYDDLVSSPTLSKIPDSVVSRIVDWTLSQAQTSDGAGYAGEQLANAGQRGHGFIEKPVQFGENGRLFGVFCKPADASASSAVLFLGAAYDRHAGWGRLSVTMARELARNGVASLRFDAANIADSPPVEGVPEQVLYDVRQNDDVVAALDFLSAQIAGPIVAAGRCSGAYLAFNGALADDRIRAVVAVNPVVFHWLKGRSVDEALHKRPRSFGEYRQRFLQGATFKRLFSGDVDVVSAVLNIIKATAKKLSTKTARLFRAKSEEGRAVYRAFETLRAKGTIVTLLYSDNDDGLEHFRYYFDSDGRGLGAYANASVTIIPDADHNLSTPQARAVYLETVTRLASQP
ncbi:alpha/beta hydrolase family protein [Rhizobium sp. RM]|uniref:alpha/beta hydrolase family protein n=1 Tax=Rhizobium sp. RM TaxID=2748079 RepID=UPI00110D3A9B|nr:alpha/beta hydrolase family protein [Rhizobium sp. RM]NWJ23386.1 alpha/beta fold hydrolase [Rhizobium sp. RM]TMV14251.1 alpha/beta fold hydrolase [Rhizobium sp. Td3]